MSFGFGVGDFIAMGNFAIKAHACLQDSTGSAADYQHLKLASSSLGATIAFVDKFLDENPDSLSEPLVNATKKHLSECYALLQNFDEITKKYNTSFSTGGSGSKAKDNWRKLKWGSVKNDIREIFRCLQGHIEAVATLMSANNMQVLLRIEKNTQETCVALERMRPAQLPQTIDWSDNKPIRFIDAFDRKITLAYEWCETWQAFREVLRASVRGQPESVWVESDSFEVLDEDNGAVLITPAKWEATISPGKTLSMAMLLRKQEETSRTREQECPTCQTAYRGFESCEDLARVRCTKCGTWFQVSSEPRITELASDDGVQLQDATKAKRIRRWRVLHEQREWRVPAVPRNEGDDDEYSVANILKKMRISGEMMRAMREAVPIFERIAAEEAAEEAEMMMRAMADEADDDDEADEADDDDDVVSSRIADDQG